MTAAGPVTPLDHHFHPVQHSYIYETLCAVCVYVCARVCVCTNKLTHASSHLVRFTLELNLFSGNYVNEKVKHIMFGDRHGNVTSL